MYIDYRGLVGFLVGMFPSHSKPNQLRVFLRSCCFPHAQPRHAGDFRLGWWQLREFIAMPYFAYWTVVYTVIMHHHMLGGLKHFLWLSIYWECHIMSSSQLTNSIIFQRGRYTTNQSWFLFMSARTSGWPLADPNASRRAACRTYASCVWVFMVISCSKKRTTGSCYWSLWCIHIYIYIINNYIYIFIYKCSIMWVQQCHKPSPNNLYLL